jgi:hypothetical protein
VLVRGTALEEDGFVEGAHRKVIVSRMYQSLGWMVIALAGGIQYLLWSIDYSLSSFIWPLAMTLPLAVLGVLWAIRPRVVLMPDRIRVVNPFRTTEIVLSDVERAEIGPILVVRLTDGSAVKAMAAQTAEVQLASGRDGFCGEAARTINAWLAAHEDRPEATSAPIGLSPDEVDRVRSEASSSVRRGLIGVGILGAIFVLRQLFGG